MRRLRFIVNFPFPGQNERRSIWQKAFPAETPVQDLDFDRLAKLNLTGGHIALIALNAAFVAANQGSAVTMPVVLDAARTEYRKLERPIHEPDFRWPPAPVRIA
jgi:SpoVK/Ycf46/Vps4 family AAA+-type ATPase